MKKRTTFSVVPWYFTIPSLIGLALILGPLLGLLYNIPWMGLHEIIDEEVVGATQLSLVTASISTLICGVIGAPLALTLCKVLDRSRLRGAGSLLYAIIYTPIIFSPVVSGLGLLFFWGRKGIIGAALYDAGIKITFTTTAVIIAQVLWPYHSSLPAPSPPCKPSPENTKKLPKSKAQKHQKSPTGCCCHWLRPASPPGSCSPSPGHWENSVPPSPSQETSKVKPRPFR